MWVLWLIVIILLTFLEVISINLICIWFIISAIVSLIMSFFIEAFYLQFAVFVGLGIVLMLLTRPILIKKMIKRDVKTNLDRVIGMEGIVSEEIRKNTVGEVKVDGKKWSAISDELIKVGSTVTITEIDGVKLKVRKEEK